MLRLLLLACGALLSSAALIDFVAVEGRRYYCSDPHSWVGDCTDDGHDPGSSGYGYHRDEGRNVGRGYYKLRSSRDAELVCDFREDGDVRDRVTNIAWVKVSNGRARSHAGYRHGGDGGRRVGKRFRRASHRDVYDSQYRHSNIVITRGDRWTVPIECHPGCRRSTYYIRDYTDADFGTYRCFGTSANGHVVYMEVDFSPHHPSGSKVTDIVFTSENAY